MAVNRVKTPTAPFLPNIEPLPLPAMDVPKAPPKPEPSSAWNRTIPINRSATKICITVISVYIFDSGKKIQREDLTTIYNYTQDTFEKFMNLQI